MVGLEVGNHDRKRLPFVLPSRSLAAPVLRKEPAVPTTTPPSWDGPLLKARTLLALDIARRDILNLALPAADGHTCGDLGGLVRASRLAAVLDRRLTYLAVITARVVHDASWAKVGNWLNVSAADAEELYGEAVQRWVEGDAAPWSPRVPGATVTGDYPIHITRENVETLAVEAKAGSDASS